MYAAVALRHPDVVLREDGAVQSGCGTNSTSSISGSADQVADAVAFPTLVEWRDTSKTKLPGAGTRWRSRRLVVLFEHETLKPWRRRRRHSPGRQAGADHDGVERSGSEEDAWATGSTLQSSTAPPLMARTVRSKSRG